MRQWQAGSAIGEYGLAIALVGILAIPAVMYAGDVIGKMYTENSAISKGDQLFSLLDQKSGPSHVYKDGTVTEIPVETAGGNGQMFRPAAGGSLGLQATLSQNLEVQPDGTVEATDTTSVSGTVKELANFLVQMEADYAEELSPELQQMISNLSKQTVGIADEQAEMLKNFPKVADGQLMKKDDDDDRPLNLFGNSNRSMDSHIVPKFEDYTAEYKRVMTAIDAQPLPPEVKSEIKGKLESSAGIVSQLTYNHFIAPLAEAKYDDEVNWQTVNDVKQLENEYLIKAKVNTAAITPRQSPVVTAEQAVLIKAQEDRLGVTDGTAGTASVAQQTLVKTGVVNSATP